MTVKLPPVVETFSDGAIYHGKVKAWYPQFHEDHRWKNVTVWSNDDSDNQRWIEPQEGSDLGPPTCWVLIQFS